MAVDVLETDEGLLFSWRTANILAQPVDVEVIITKEGSSRGLRVIRSMTAHQGSFLLRQYSAGLFKLQATLHQGDKVEKYEKAVETEGNVPVSCPPRPIWKAEKSPSGPIDPFSVQDLIAHSNLVLRGQVLEIIFCPPQAQGSMPYTFVSLKVGEVLGGQYDSPIITIPVAGGCMDGFCTVSSHIPQFVTGMDVILFLRAGHLVPITGWSRGIFRITPNGEVTTYDAQPIITINSKDSLELAEGSLPLRVPFDPAYGPLALVSSPLDESQKNQGAPADAVSVMSVDEFSRAIRWIKVKRNIPDPTPGTLLPPGTPFEFGPLKAELPVLTDDTGASPMTKEVGSGLGEGDH